jgi:Putative abortive phage resistance protein AbiGi, antitoxin
VFGFRGNVDWRDMSDFVVHFTKDHGGKGAYDNSLSILYEGRIRARNTFGAARSIVGLGASQKCVCFSEVPLGQLQRLVDRCSLYGIGFEKEVVASQGGAPVWYLEKDTPVANAFVDLRRKSRAGGLDPDDPIWRLTPFVDMPGEYNGSPYRFEWERQWRVAGDFRFSTDDVAFLLIPDDLHVAARDFFVQVERDNSGPAYFCPFLDPTWGEDEIEGELAAGPYVPEPEPVGPDNCEYRFVFDTGLCPSCGHFHGELCLVCGGMHGPI